jgi:DNA-binding transcriptional ArsR family regulator
MLGQQTPIDGIFAALGDPTRRAIVERLTGREATVSELARPFEMSLSAVHQHLALLEGAGLVACEKRGRERWCRLETKAFDRIEKWLSERRRLWERRLDVLDAYLAEGGTDAPPRRRRK